ncbi:MAG: amidohydrolase family protein [Chloroflexota bacterium]
MQTQNNQRAVIDCDLHNVVPSFAALKPYLTAHWQEFFTQAGFRGPSVASMYTSGGPIQAKVDVNPPNGGPPGSDLALLRQHILDPLNVEVGILNCGYAVESMRNPYAAEALSSGVNNWQMAEWLEPEPRLRASLVVPSQDPDLAVKEVQRLGNHPGFVQIFLPVHSPELYGQRRFFPIYQAAVEHDLAIGIHFGGEPGTAVTASGWPSFYVEVYAAMAQLFQSQVMSMVVEGVFEEFPTLRVALIASGITWLPALLWRMDKEWKGLRREVPWVKKPPSDYIREHVKMTLHPIDAPPHAHLLTQIFDQIDCDDMVMFSTDYPYGHFNTIDEAIPAGIPMLLEEKILAENARAFYRL